MTKNITLSAEARLIEQARKKAAGEKRTLNTLFREWLARYVACERSQKGYEELMESLSYVSAGRTFNRDELNER